MGTRQGAKRPGWSCPLLAAAVVALAPSTPAVAAEIPPLRLMGGAAAQEAAAVYSERTLVLGIEVHRDGARLVAYTVKERPLIRSLDLGLAGAVEEGGMHEIEVVLANQAGEAHTRRTRVGPICLAHSQETEPHVAGDTIVLHRDAFIVEMPEVAGLDRLEVAHLTGPVGFTIRRSLTSDRLDASRFSPAGSAFRWEDLALSDATSIPESKGGEDPGEGTASAPPTSQQASTLLWPEHFGDPNIYKIYGKAAEGNRRINVVIVPDGYLYAEKPIMENHAAALVSTMRARTPYAEHDALINYTLVYAYSQQNGTDQCDCSIVRNTAMGTRFPSSNPTCGDLDNRCLYYGGGCDTSGEANIVAAELRAPYHDTTVVMVNTPRYGGCGGLRGVYSAGHGSAKEIAMHELGHSLAGLADEYESSPNCGSGAGEVNTSSDPVDGAWPEWVSALGAPRQGAQYFSQCLFRPLDNCMMRALAVPFCAVCNQRWSLVFFGHPRVSPTAPISAAVPDPASGPVTATAFEPVDFSVETRLASGGGVTNLFEWRVLPPGVPSTVLVATGSPAYTHTFTDPGSHEMEARVVADTNFVRPERYGANEDRVTWTVQVAPLAVPPEISPPGSSAPLSFTDLTTLVWEDLSGPGAVAYNLYRGPIPPPPAAPVPSCLQAGLAVSSGVDAASPPPGVAWFYLVTGKNEAGEGPLGWTSEGAPRPLDSPCATGP